MLAKICQTVSSCLLMLACLCSFALAAEIYTVDVGKIMDSSLAAETARKHVAEVEKILKKGFEDLSAAWSDQPDEEKRKVLGEGAMILRRQAQMEREAAAGAVRELMLEEIKKWRMKNGAPVVLARENLLDSAENLDVTPDILKAMDAREVKFAALPKVTAQKPEKAAKPAKKSSKKKKEGK